MSDDFWQQQTDQPLFPNMLWSRPETKQGAGKMLVIGGQAQEFIHVAESFAAAEDAGAGTVRVFMPESTRKLTKMLPNIEYAPSNASGSFSSTALAELLEASQWCDGTLLAGDLGKNSETNLMLESFMAGYNGTLIVASATLPSITMPAKDLFQSNNTVLVLTFGEFQKLGVSLGLSTPITSDSSTPVLAALLHDITTKYPVALTIMREKVTWTASTGNVALTHPKKAKSVGQLSAQTAVWCIQNPNKTFEAITTAVYS